MNSEPEGREPWEVPELKEGFDVYDYDPRRARRGQRVVLAVFVLTLILFVLSYWLKWRAEQPYRPEPRPQPARWRLTGRAAQQPWIDHDDGILGRMNGSEMAEARPFDLAPQIL